MQERQRLVVGVSGASGAVYAVRALDALRELGVESHLVVSRAAVPDEAHQRLPARPQAELPTELIGRLPADPHPVLVDAAQVMPSTHGDSIVLLVTAAPRAEDAVVVVEILSRRARRHHAAPAVALEDRVAMTRLGGPLRPHVLE